MAEDQKIQTAVIEGREGIGGCCHDGFASQVKRGVHQHRNASYVAERFDQLVVERGGVSAHGLDPSAPVSVGNSWQRFFEFVLNWHNIKHEAMGIVDLWIGDFKKSLRIRLNH